MANTVARRVILNGSRNYVVEFTVVGDGTGEETLTRINETSGDMGTDNKIMSINYVLNGFNAKLYFDASTDLFAWGLDSDKQETVKFNKVGGLVNNAGTGKTGDLLITTTGLGIGDSGSIIVWFRKKA